MTNSDLQNPEIYIGSRIEHASERAVLEEIFRVLSHGKRPAIVLANVNLNGRQIDTILVLDDLTLVIEAKGYSRPIRGGENGAWQVHLASGGWKDFENPYLQALAAKNELRDAMRAFIGSDIGYYPSAAVIFVADIPNGSSVYAGDFKVSVLGLNSLSAEIQKKQTGCWSLAQWRAFARRHRLLSVSSIEAAYDPELLNAEQLIARYSSEYLRTYRPDAAELVEYACNSGEREFTSENIVHQISVERADILLIGPSGCGKSLLAVRTGVSLLQHGGIPVTIPAKEYQGNLKAVIDREAGLLSNCSGTALLKAARRLNRPTLLILDGYNECQDDERRIALTRSVAALGRRSESGILITSRIPIARGDLLSLREVKVPVPSRKVKLAIATKASAGQAVSPEMENLIDSVASGLEASLVGEVGREINTSASRYGLFDAFVRKRLGALATEGIRALSLIAGWLSDHVTFSVSVRDLDRLVQAEHIPSSLLPQLTGKNLLHSRGDRVSFGHELFFNTFASESVIRRAAGRPEQIVAALGSPRHADRRELIVGAIDDDSLLVHVLERISDPSIVAFCLSGSCGRLAREWAETRYPKILVRMRKEIEGVRFVITDQGWWNVAIDPDTLEAWSELDRAFIRCAPDLLAQGRYLVEILDLVAVMDRRISEETARLRDEARERKMSLRSPIFGISYVMQQLDSPALTLVCSRIHSGLFSQSVCMDLVEEIQQRMGRSDFSPGQLYLLVTLSKHFGRQNTIVASFITWAIQQYWAKAPHHLRLELVDAAGYCWDVGGPERSALIAAVESLLDNKNPLLNSLIFDVLGRLDALESEGREYAQTIREQLDQLLAGLDDPENCAAAHHIYVAQFDHPYSGAYWDVVNDLPDEQRKKFLMMAAKGVQDSQFFLSPLIVEVASFNEPLAGETVSRWTALPPPDSFMPQEAIEVFVMAHVALARLGCELPNREAISANPSADALLACGTVLYWSNRLDLVENKRCAACDEAWTILNRPDNGVALNAIKDCAHVRLEGTKKLLGGTDARTSIAYYFPAETAEVCRRALERPEKQVGYFRNFFDRDKFQALGFALHILGTHGNGADLPLLRRFSDHSHLGPNAIRAIQVIEQRLSFT